MKKQSKNLLGITLALTLAMTLAACSGNIADPGAQSTATADTAVAASSVAGEETTPEEEWEPIPEDLYAGLWYTTVDGFPLTLELKREGDYTMTIGVVIEREDGSVSSAAATDEPLNGTWTLEEELVYLDGEEEPSFEMRSGMLYWLAGGIFFEAEAPELYQPAALLANAKKGDFDGYWVSTFAAVDELVLNAETVDDNTDLYIEGDRAALGGDIFGDDNAKFSLADGLMTYTDGTGGEKITVTLGLQEDGMLRLVFTGGEDDPLTLYLSRIPSEEELAQWEKELEEALAAEEAENAENEENADAAADDSADN